MGTTVLLSRMSFRKHFKYVQREDVVGYKHTPLMSQTCANSNCSLSPCDGKTYWEAVSPFLSPCKNSFSTIFWWLFLNPFIASYFLYSETSCFSCFNMDAHCSSQTTGRVCGYSVNVYVSIIGDVSSSSIKSVCTVACVCERWQSLAADF